MSCPRYWKKYNEYSCGTNNNGLCESKSNNKVVNNIYNFVENTNPRHIFLDVDGVLLHSAQGMVEVLNRKYNTNFDGSQVFSWNFNNLIPDLTSEEIESLFESQVFFTKVKFIDGAIDFIKKYKDKIIIVTKARPNNFINKVALFEKNDLDIPIIPIPLSVSKNVIDMTDSLFIDDSANNLNESNAKYKIMFCEYKDDKDREWQRNWNGLKMYKW